METPGGEAPRLPDSTRLGAVNLTVQDGRAMSEFYQSALGMKVQQEGPQGLALGYGGESLVRLFQDPNAVEAGRHASLYHYCLAVEHREDLGWWLRRLLDQGRELQGLVDHRMAEAVYLQDPEGNGIELNWDRPRSAWRPWSEWLAMGNAPLDTQGLLEANERAGVRNSPPSSTRVGHVHLHVGDLGAAEAFYCATLGLTKTAEVPGQAVFTAAGGYHHHIAFNVWRGRGVAAQPQGAYGLRWATLVLPEASDVRSAGERLNAAGYAVEALGEGLFTRDPSGHGLLLTPSN